MAGFLRFGARGLELRGFRFKVEGFGFGASGTGTVVIHHLESSAYVMSSHKENSAGQ